MSWRHFQHLSRQLLLVLFLLLALSACETKAPKKSQVKNVRPTPTFTIPEKMPGRRYLYFIAIGDQGTGGRGQHRVAALMSKKAQKDSLHLVLTLGDNFYDKGVVSVNDPQWQIKFEDMYDLPHLNVPFYASLGNHDHKGNTSYQVEFSALDQKWKMPAPYYTFTRQIDDEAFVQFFVLDTERIAGEAPFQPEQIAWIEQELQRSTATWKVVYGHHPVFSYGMHGDQEAMIDYVRPLLEKYDVTAYICGHDHDRQFLGPVNGVYYIVSGTGAKSRHTQYGKKTVFAATNLGFTWFRVSAEDFHVQFLDGDGKIEFAHTWTKSSAVKHLTEELSDIAHHAGKSK